MRFKPADVVIDSVVLLYATAHQKPHRQRQRQPKQRHQTILDITQNYFDIRNRKQRNGLQWDILYLLHILKLSSACRTGR